MSSLVKVTPPVTVTGMSLAGVHLQDWVYILTIVYLLCQIGVLVYNFIKGRK